MADVDCDGGDDREAVAPLPGSADRWSAISSKRSSGIFWNGTSDSAIRAMAFLIHAICASFFPVFFIVRIDAKHGPCGNARRTASVIPPILSQRQTQRDPHNSPSTCLALFSRISNIGRSPRGRMSPHHYDDCVYTNARAVVGWRWWRSVGRPEEPRLYRPQTRRSRCAVTSKKWRARLTWISPSSSIGLEMKRRK